MVLLLGTAFLTGCGSNDPRKAQTPTNNSMTRYTEDLHNDTRQAQRAADKADALIKQQNEQVKDLANE